MRTLHAIVGRRPSALLAAVLLASLPARQAPAQVPADGVPVVTLGEARRRSLSVDPQAVAARGQIEAATWERRAAVSNLFAPQVFLTGNYAHSPDSVFDQSTFAPSVTASSATLQARYTVIGAGKFAGLRSSRASLVSAEAGDTEARFAAALATDAAWYSVHASRELARVAGERRRRAEEQFGVARARVAAGEAIASDSLQLLLEVNRARVAVLSADSALAVSRLRLGRRIGLPGAADAAPHDTATPPPLALSQEEAIAELRARGPRVVAARAAEDYAQALVNVQRERYLPEVVVTVGRSTFNNNTFPTEASRSDFGVGVSLPIWNAGQRELGVARALVERDIARATRADRERASAETMAQAYHGYVTARAGIELARTAVAAASETFRVQRARYGEGATTILDLLEAQVGLSEAEANLVRSRYGARIALAQIEALLGRRLIDTTTPQD